MPAPTPRSATYAITASGATGAGLSNYAITYVDGLLNVVPGSGDGGGAGTQLTTTAVQAINTSVAVATTSDAVGAAPTRQQKADEAAKELAAATQASGGGTVTAATRLDPDRRWRHPRPERRLHPERHVQRIRGQLHHPTVTGMA